MAADKVKFGHFCRRWKITDPGENIWPSLLDLSARFVIVRSSGKYRFIPLAGVKGALKEKTLEKLENDSYGQGHRGKKLKGALTAEFDGLRVLFTLNEINTDEFEISLSKDSAPLSKTAAGVVHGGPHGVDD